ncbi:MAG: YfhO family protein [Clostridia bacterium]|nr:YfhO family protein [Clostridia bacterium]
MKTKLTEKKGNIFSRNINCFAASIIAAVIMIFAYIVWEFFPVGENIILRMDLYHQYAPLLAELYERIFGGDSLLYSFTSGLGSGFLGNYFNYLSSPTALIIMIFGHFNIPEAVAGVVLVKAAASAYTFTYFLSKITKKSDLSTTAFGLLYAFCGYFVAYYWNIMWLDAMVMFPIVMLGIWYIINDGRSLTYVLSLAFIMMTNYYMAYMTCILSVIFFIYFYFSTRTLGDKLNKDIILKEKYQKSLKTRVLNSTFLMRGANFAASSVLAAMLAAFALLPVFFVLQNSSATSSNFPSSFASYFSIFDFFANHLAGVTPTIRSSGDTVYPNIYCGIITLVLVPLFMFSNRFTHREKIATAAVGAVFFLSFNINYLNFIWHGFHFPNDLPYRFSFAYSFFLLYIAYRVFTNIDKIPAKSILVSASAVAGFAVLVEEIGSANVDLKVVWTSVIFAIVYAVVLIFIKNPRYVKSSILLLLLTSVCAEILIADTPNYKVTQTKSAYTSSYEDTEGAIDIIREKEGENTFYRMELVTLLTRMDNSWFYYPGVSAFTSMAYEDVAALQDKLGLYGNKINSYTYNMQTGLYNSMVSIKYVVNNASYVGTDNYKPNFEGDFLYTEVGEYGDDMTVYLNNYWLPVAFGVDENLDTDWDYDSSNPFAVQNDFYYLASGVSDLLEPIAGTIDTFTNIDTVSDEEISEGSFSVYKTDTAASSNGMSYVYDIAETQNVYVFFSGNSNVESILVSTDGFTYNQSVSGKPYVLNVGNVEAGSKVYISYELKEDAVSSNIEQYVYGLKKSKMDEAYNSILANGTLDVTENEEDYIKGTVNLSKGSMLYTSIPYDKGWNVYVDGVEVSDENIVKVGDALMGVKMESGEHTVEFKYTPGGLVAGLIITFAGFALLIIILILKKKERFVFSESFKKDILTLGMWRDKAAEAEITAARELEQAQLEQQLEAAKTEDMFSAEADESWFAALAEAESFFKKSMEESAPEVATAEEVQPEENDSDETEATDDDGFVDISDGDVSIEDVLEEFEKATDDVVSVKPRISADDKKSAKKKRLGLVIFLTVIAVAIVAGIVIMLYAADNNNETPDNGDNLIVEQTDDDVNAPVSEEDSSDERTTVATTASTTEQTTENTTASTTAATTAGTTEGTTAGNDVEYIVHTVKYGDNFYSILREYGIRDTRENVQKFCDFNGLPTSASLSIGQKLKVPTDY